VVLVQQEKMTLAQLLKELEIDISNLEQGFHNKTIERITLNSKKIIKNSIFISLKGQSFDGNNYIEDALSSGAITILSDNQSLANVDKNIFYVQDLAINLVKIAQYYYNNLPGNLVAVTGTNGKTSIVNFVKQLYCLLKKPVATIGTMGSNINLLDKVIKLDSTHTTPDILSFYDVANRAKSSGCDNLIFEASSHAIAQKRIAGVKVKIAAFSNLSQDHLDYHQNMENYFAAKAKLFSNYLHNDGIAIINSDSEYAIKLADICKQRSINCFFYGKKALDLKLLPLNNEVINLLYKDHIYQFNFNLKGEFQLYNLLCAIAILLHNGFKISDIITQIPHLKAVEGRMEEIKIRDNFRVFIDYAHTPDGLENVLKSVAGFSKRKIILVFGCGGDRDKGKRSLMAKIASKYSDYIIVTDDNPRNEDPQEIRTQILNKINNKDNVIEIANRKAAIIKALNIAKQDDIILITGKGHEKYQIINNKKYFFSDSCIVKEFYN
jgi:UDP-N-acetylmuramoyl-L-alanyl-D-glutamate--2,6-diaminopimelate ligase